MVCNVLERSVSFFVECHEMFGIKLNMINSNYTTKLQTFVENEYIAIRLLCKFNVEKCQGNVEVVFNGMKKLAV